MVQFLHSFLQNDLLHESELKLHKLSDLVYFHTGWIWLWTLKDGIKQNMDKKTLLKLYWRSYNTSLPSKSRRWAAFLHNC